MRRHGGAAILPRMRPVPAILADPSLQSFLGEPGFWPTVLALVACAAAVAAAIGVWVLVGRARELGGLAGRPDALEELVGHVRRIAAERDDIDLRRIEHALVDLRDGQRRLADAFLRTVEVEARERLNGGAATAGDRTLAERVTDRLLSLGFDEVRIVTDSAELCAIADSDPAEGSVLVEARLSGVLHKGRVQVRDGRIVDQELRSAHSIFP